jgi:hypothetical protein
MADIEGLEFEPRHYVDEFLEKYFKDIADVVKFEEEFADKYELVKTDIDYFRIKRFLTTAFRNFREIDDKFIAGLLMKLQKDVYGLFDYYQKFITSTQVADIVYQRDFLSALKPYQDTVNEMTTTKARRDILETQFKRMDELMRLATIKAEGGSEEAQKELKVLKDKYSDIVHNFALARDKLKELAEKLSNMHKAFHDSFLEGFDSQRNYYIKRLSELTNSKAYHLDKLLWDRALKNRRISDFLESAGIKGSYDTKTFIKYYLRNININSTADQEWHMYLKKVLEMLD